MRLPQLTVLLLAGLVTVGDSWASGVCLVPVLEYDCPRRNSAGFVLGSTTPALLTSSRC